MTTKTKTPEIDRRKKWLLKMVAKHRCIVCGGPTPINPRTRKYQLRCDPHQQAANALNREYKAKARRKAKRAKALKAAKLRGKRLHDAAVKRQKRAEEKAARQARQATGNDQ